MKLFPVLPMLWPTLLALLGLHNAVAEGNNADICNVEIDSGELHKQDSTGYEDIVEMTDGEKMICLLYPSKELNCSWSFSTSEKDAHLSVSVGVCNDSLTIQSMKRSSVETVGSASWTLNNLDFLQVILHCNMSHSDMWTAYTSLYDMEIIEVLSPPTDVSASVKNGDLYVTWVRPHTRATAKDNCFEYELYIDDQESSKNIIGKQFYTKPKADLTHTYNVRIRTRIHNECFGSIYWSDWSSTVTVEPSSYKFNPLVIVLISLGVPMILLAVLLLVRYQRVTKVLFPEIPRPPEKYKNFLEKYDTLTFFYPVLTAKPEEEITVVEDNSFLKNISIQELP